MNRKILILSNLACLFFATTSFAGWNVKKQDSQVAQTAKPIKEINDCQGCGQFPGPVYAPVAAPYIIPEQPLFRQPNNGPIYGPTTTMGIYLRFVNENYYNYTAPAGNGPYNYSAPGAYGPQGTIGVRQNW